jgi:hypothetical protein|tara:strand:+ start:1531 stop:1854 length:324 start_codon:yes stop_codon:yes gene_type:complete
MSIEDMQTKVAQWTEDNSDHEDFDLVNELMSRFEKTGRVSHLKSAYALTVSTRQKIVLSDEDMQIRDSKSKELFDLLSEYPSLSIPRNRTLENIQEAFEKAIKASKR